MNIGQAENLAGVAAKRGCCYQQIDLIDAGSRPECPVLNDLPGAAA